MMPGLEMKEVTNSPKLDQVVNQEPGATPTIAEAQVSVAYSESILVDNVFYYFKKELGRGTFGVVYLYESKTGKKLVNKIFKGGINT